MPSILVDLFGDGRQNEDMERTTRHRVVTFVAPGNCMFELSVAGEVFGSDPQLGMDWYRFSVAAEHPGPLALGYGLSLDVKHGLSAFRSADTIVVAGWPTHSNASPQLLAAIRGAHRRGVRMVSFCTGTFLLAEAGLLDGRKATTHWNAADRFRLRHPDIHMDADVLYVDNGDVLTSAGSASAIDLAIHVVRNDHGAHVANLVARQLVVAPHRHGGQAQFVMAPSVSVDEQQSLGATLEWITEHLHQDLPLTAMARHANLSTRQFSRRFQESAGTTPHQWLIRQRVLHAQELLEQGHLSIEEVAQRCGFRSAAAMRPHFARMVTTSPADYRRCFAHS